MNMKKIILILTILLLFQIPLATAAGEIASYGIEIICTITFYTTYYGGPLDPDGHGTTYLSGTEPDWIVYPDGSWEIIPAGPSQ